ncbi:MAG: hypothetical protein M1815_004543 [Lichina confinis]|nr:MAG: hypothetical protein M1815_004543 [Lichina confinis]
MISRKKNKPGSNRSCKLLSTGRPPSFGQALSRLGSKTSRRLISTHHRLSKEKAKALQDGDAAAAAVIDSQIEAEGGLQVYQQASRSGQSLERGGDSSRILCEWLSPLKEKQPLLLLGGPQAVAAAAAAASARPRMLEIGALSTENACSRSGIFDVTRIDLHATDAGIRRQDFMTMALPTSDAERFHMISLSLVLNYVPDAVARGDMLLRTTEFLLRESTDDDGPARLSPSPSPSLFLVLPAPCVTNSRYLTEARLVDIMRSLGYVLTTKRQSSKLLYYLWRFRAADFRDTCAFAKVELHPGKRRNNFAIVRA